MQDHSVIQLLAPDSQHSPSRYAIVDCAVTQDEDTIYTKLISEDIEKYNLLAGEMARVNDHVAPVLLPLSNQPELEKWLLNHGWGVNWAIYFTADAGIDSLLGHFRQYLNLEAPNGRNIFFRFYDAVVLGDFIPTLTDQEAISFFGPVQRYVFEGPQGEPVVFERPSGQLLDKTEPSNLVLGAEKRKPLSEKWQRRLLGQHAGAYRELGLNATPDALANAIIIEDRAGKTTRLQKTAAGVTATTGEQRSFQYELTTCKHPAAITDPAGNRIDFDVQERDNKEKRNTIPILSAIRMEAGQKTWVFDYDDMHHLKGIDYPDDTHAKLSHDSYGNLTDVVDRNGNATRFTYDFDERLTEFEDANGHATRFDYEDLSAPSNIAFADGASFGFEYTDAGALEKFLAGNALVADYEVDHESGSWKVNYTDGGHAEFIVESGKIVQATNAAGSVDLAYDDAGNLIKETFRNRSVTYHRNETGQLTGITTPFDQTIRYIRDGEDRTCGIEAWSGRNIGIQYAPNGALESIAYPNGTRLEQQTNAQGLPTHMHLRGADGTLFYKKFRRDRLNRINQIKDGDGQIDYGYDKEGRLINVESNHGDFNEAFGLDAQANRLSDHKRQYAVNEADRLTQAGNTAYAYDNLGNLKQGACPRGGADFSFTDLNRLKSIDLKCGSAQYLYDAFGRRVAKKVNGTTTRFYWAQNQLLHEVQFNPAGDSETTGVTDYLFFPETPVLLAIRQNQQVRWAAFGHRYEVLCLSDEGGKVVWQAQYDAFGRAHVDIGEKIHQPFRLAGQYYDQESGLHYNLARYYDPSLGRFLSLDPLFLEGGSSNFYAYCNGDPINYIDPSGEFIFTAILIGAAVGAIIGATVEHIRQSRSGEETDGFKIARAALIGGVIGAIGGGVGAAVEAAAAAGALGTAMATSALPAMATVGFLSGAGASVAEQCAEAQVSGNGVSPLSMAQQALTDGVIGAGTALITFGTGGFLARRLRKGSALFQPTKQSERSVQLAQKSKQVKSTAPAPAKQKGRKKSDKSKLCEEGDPVNAITGEVTLSQSDFTLPGRIPLTWTRHYGSQSDYSGYLGGGWQTPADARLEIDSDEMVIFYDGTPGGAVFEKLPTDEPVMEAADGALISVVQDHYQVRLKSGLRYHFAKAFSNNQTLVTRVSDANGNFLAFDRDPEHGLVQIRDNSGQCITPACKNGRIERMALGDKLLVAYRYDGDQLATAADALGQQKRFYYEDGRLARHMDKNKLSFYYTYDDAGRCTHTWGDNGLYEYRFEHKPYDRCVAVTDSRGDQKTYYYDQDRLPIKEQDQIGGSIIYDYDDVGRIIKVTDPLERITEYDYDAAGNVLEIIRPDNNRTVFVYDDHHRPIQVLDANGKIWEQRFNEKGRLVEKISPLDERIQYNYNAQGDPVTMTDPQEEVTAFEYDDHGLVSAVTDGQSITTRYQRDLMGNITAIIGPTGRTTRYVYDASSRLVQTVQPSGTDQRYTWDGEDNLLRYTDPNGDETLFEYGGVNEIVRRINADGTSISYQYDTEENLTAITNEKGQTHQFVYDHAGRVTSQTDYYGHTTQYAYDAAGQLTHSCNPLEQSIAYAYDPAGRLATKTFESEEQEVLNWDANGNLTAIQSPDALVERFYDAANRLVAEKSGEFVVEYSYDANGRCTGRTTSHGNHVQYRYDDIGALCAVQINDQPPVTIERNALGQVTREQFSHHLERGFAYTDDGLLSHQSISGSSGGIERSYAYDAAGNLTAKQDTVKGPWQFRYNPMGRITEALDPEQQLQRFGYDPAGDLLDHLPDTGHRLRSARYNQTEYRFDAAGNLAERQTDEELTRFAWDEQNRLKAVRTTDDTRITMGYDALGRRHIKAVNGERTFFHWDGDALLSEQMEDGPVREYVYYPGTFEPLAAIDGDGQVYYYHNDPNGLPQELTRSNGEMVWSASYDALGRVDQLLVDAVAQPLRMQGQYWDAEIGLCYNRHRYFDPQVCAFISQDPLGLAAGENVYAYAPNVWGWIDPLGLKCEDTANIYHYPGSATNPYGHYSIETIDNNKPIHSHQVITELDRSNTKIINVIESPPSKVPDKIVEVKLPNAKGAQLYQKSIIGKELGPYDQKTNSCVDHVSEVLRAGEVDVPKSALGQYKYLKGIGF